METRGESDQRYDVAISFRWPDREHARALHEALRDRLDVFYSEESMEEIAGTDGEKTFSEVFHDHCRVAVIFYSDDWGETPFTRPEKTAIKRRGFEEGYDFSLWIPMGEPPVVPAFVPRQNLWLDFERLGIDGLTAAVENAIQRSGKEVRPQSTLDELRQIDREISLEENRAHFIGSKRGMQFVRDAQGQLKGLVESRIEEYQGVRSIPFKVKEEHRYLEVTSWPYRQRFHLAPMYGNSARGTKLHVYKQKRVGEHPKRSHWKETGESIYDPTLDMNGDPAWKSPGGEFLSLEEVVAKRLDPMAKKVFQQKHRDLQYRR